MPRLLTLPDHRADLPLSPKRLAPPDLGMAWATTLDYDRMDHPHKGIGCWRERVVRGLVIIASLDCTPHGTLMHVSFSYSHRLPDWNDVKAVRAAFFPSDIDAMMVLPQEQDYVNVHPYTFHLWQMPVAWGIR